MENWKPATNEEYLAQRFKKQDNAYDNDNQNYFKWGEYMFIDNTWAKLSAIQKAIYPVITVHCDSDGYTFVGYETIKELSGIGNQYDSAYKKAINKALDGLVAKGLLE